MRVIFRADGGENHGLGHLVRCFAVAEMIQGNFLVEFACIDIPDETFLSFEKKKIKVHRIVSDYELLKLVDANTIVVLDGYNFSLGYQQEIKSLGGKLVCIDDLVNTETIADVVINHAPGISTRQYHGTAGTIFALGIDYAMLRKEFLDAAQKPGNRSNLKNVLINFGGSDPRNLSYTVLQHCIPNKNFEKISLVTGNSYKCRLSLKDLMAGDARIHLYQSLEQKQMFYMMMESDLAIVPSSGILFEAIACSCLVASGCYVQNQKAIYKGFSEMNAFIDLKDFKDLNMLKSIDFKTLSGTRKGIIDGKSGQRINQLFLQIIQ